MRASYCSRVAWAAEYFWLTIVVACLCVGSADSAAAKEPTVVRFDAGSVPPKFDSVPKNMRRGEKLKLVVENVDTIHKKYTLQIKSTDYRTTTLPGPLAVFLITSKPSTVGGSTPPVAEASKFVTVPPALQNAFTNLQTEVLTRFQSVVTDEPAVITKPRLDEDLIAAIDGWSTNVEIRRAVAEETLTFIKHVDDFTTPKIGQPDSSGKEPSTRLKENMKALKVRIEGALKAAKGKDLGNALLDVGPELSQAVDVPQRMNRQALTDVRQRFFEWKNAYLKWRPTPTQERIEKGMQISEPAGEETIKRVDALDQLAEKLLEFATARYEARSTDLQNIRGRVQRAQVIYAICENPKLTPASLEKEDTITGDLAGVGVVIESGVNGPLPPAPGATDGQTPPTPPERANFARNIPTYGRWVLDFAAGVVVTNLESQYYYAKKNSGGTAIVRRGVGDASNVAPAVVAHFYQTQKGNLNAGPILGIAPGDPTRYLGGLGITYGQRNRITLLLGLAFGKVNRLNGDIVGEPANGSSPAQQSVYRYGQFIGLGFNLSLK